MVNVQLRNSGEGLWSSMSLPTSVQLAQTLAGAARQLNLADEVRIQPCEPQQPAANRIDLRV